MSRLGTYALVSHFLTVAVAVSYLTLGMVRPDIAESFWAPYAIATAILAAVNLHAFQRARDGR